MHCIKCGKPLPDDSEFCPFCGITVVKSSEPSLIFQVTSPINKESPKTIKQTSHLVIAIALSILLLALGALNVIQYISNRNYTVNYQKEINNYKQSIDDYKEEISTLEAEKDTLQESKKNLTSDVQKWRKNAQEYEDASEIVDLIEKYGSNSFGYASNNFHTSTGVVVLNSFETKKITLTAYWSNGGTVDLERYDSAVGYMYPSVEFGSESWTTSTSLGITANTSGAYIYKFSTTASSEAFNLLIIVK